VARAKHAGTQRTRGEYPRGSQRSPAATKNNSAWHGRRQRFGSARVSALALRVKCPDGRCRLTASQCARRVAWHLRGRVGHVEALPGEAHGIVLVRQLRHLHSLPLTVGTCSQQSARAAPFHHRFESSRSVSPPMRRGRARRWTAHLLRALLEVAAAPTPQRLRAHTASANKETSQHNAGGVAGRGTAGAG
jgi:hypothetical protein